MSEALVGQVKTEDDMINLETEKSTVRQKLLKQIGKSQAEFTFKHEPFCFRCARIDVLDEQQRLWNRKGGMTGADRIENVEIEFDVKAYSLISRFKLVAEKPVKQEKLMDGMRTSVETGVFKEFVCKERGCGITVEVPNERGKK